MLIKSCASVSDLLVLFIFIGDLHIMKEALLCKCSHFWRWQIVLVRQLKAYVVGVLFRIPRINCLFYLTVITRMSVLRNQTCLCDSVNSNTQSGWRPVFFQPKIQNPPLPVTLSFWGCLHQLTRLWSKGFQECG